MGLAARRRRTCLAERGHSCPQQLPNASLERFVARSPQSPLQRTGMSALRAKRVQMPRSSAVAGSLPVPAKNARCVQKPATLSLSPTRRDFSWVNEGRTATSTVSRVVQPSIFDRPAGASPASVKAMEPSSHSRLEARETSSRASSAVNGPGREPTSERRRLAVGPEVLATRRAATLSEHCCLVKTAHANPIGVEHSGGRTSSRLVKAPIPGDGNSGGVRVVARREGLLEQRREGDWRSPERAKTELNSREAKQVGAPETGGSGRSSEDGQASITSPEPRACGLAGEPNRHDCKAMASQEDKNAWTCVGAEERAKERSNVRLLERKGRSDMADFQPYWGKPTVRNEWRGQGKRERNAARAFALLDSLLVLIRPALHNSSLRAGLEGRNRQQQFQLLSSRVLAEPRLRQVVDEA